MNQIVKDTLDEVNKIRKVLGKTNLIDLPKGERQVCDVCPIARALGRQVSMEIIFFNDNDNFNQLTKIGLIRRGTSFNYELPLSLKLFIKEFDAAKLPEYDLLVVKDNTIEIEGDNKILDIISEKSKPFNFT